MARLAERPGESGLFTDFDGTLAPIVADPSSARPLPGALAAMASLARSLAKVAVVSGRPVLFLAEQFGAAGDGVELFGLHGLERWAEGAARPVAEAASYREAVARARREASAAAIPGLVVEDKGLGLTLHWRNAGDKEAAGRSGSLLAERLGEAHGLLLRPGKASVELVPPLGVDKGTVVRREGRGLGVVSFFGDDAGDLHAFTALDELAAEGAETLRVAVDSPEAPPELLSRADLVLGRPEEAVALLAELARRLSRRRGAS